MQKRTRSLIEELEELGKNRDMNHIIENRATNIITSAINLLELLNKCYDQETSELLEKKLLSAIKNKDSSKFTRHIKKRTVHENK